MRVILPELGAFHGQLIILGDIATLSLYNEWNLMMYINKPSENYFTVLNVCVCVRDVRAKQRALHTLRYYGILI